MPRVIHFEIPADDPERAVAFYQQVFGWKIQKWAGPGDYWLATTGEESEPGIDGAITLRSNLASVTNTIGVTSLDEAVAKVTSAGGSVVQPRITVPTVGYVAYCRDTEGNLFGVIQEDPSAK